MQMLAHKRLRGAVFVPRESPHTAGGTGTEWWLTPPEMVSLTPLEGASEVQGSAQSLPGGTQETPASTLPCVQWQLATLVSFAAGCSLLASLVSLHRALPVSASLCVFLGPLCAVF